MSKSIITTLRTSKGNYPQTLPDFEIRPNPVYRPCACGGWRGRGAKKCRECWIKLEKPPLDPFTYLVKEKPRRRIPLTQGQYAWVDAHNYERLMKFSYSAEYSKAMRSFYAVRSMPDNRKRVRMHTDILSVPSGMVVDHIISGDTLNNCEDNIRLATSMQNSWNRRIFGSTQSGYRGVSIRGSKFRSVIFAGGVRHYLGLFSTAEEAHAAYNKAALRLHGEFAYNANLSGYTPK